MSVTLDPRVRMRDALRDLVNESPTRFDKPSLFVLRNRLLDRTGSDARPLAEFLIEALRRGWRDRLPSNALASSQFDATVAPFVLQWSTERFVQPDMARWAVESWAYALNVIDASQLRISPPPPPPAPRESMAAMAARLNAGAAKTARAAAPLRSPAMAPPRPPAARKVARPTTRPPSTYTAPSTGSGRLAPRPSGGSSVPAWIPKALFGTICAMLLVVVVRVVVANATGETDAPALATNDSTSVAVVPVTPPVPAGPAVANSPVEASPGMATTPAPSRAGNTTTSARTVAPSLTGGVTIMAPERPGVPSLTRGLLSTAADSTRMVYVQPARRAAGDGRRMQTPSVNTPLTFDELRFVDGAVMRGRVDVVRAGTIIFRDMRTGLRHEYRKDDIDELITEFGTVVRFRGAAAAPAAPASASRRVAGAAAVREAAAKAGNSVRGKGVAGRYRVKYAAASAVGSPECTQVWKQPPAAEDIAVVTHVPGADTLAIAFERGDVFPSTVAQDGYFASTFRIVPDQARTMTALTTRLTGRFLPKGELQVTVNIVFYRRLRTGEVTCNVTVNAEGRVER